ncbi:Uncharacterised protein [Bordetella pertussis]|nr:Uncharacterised protein [Bordetella pertussis]
MARGGELPGATHASQALFMPSNSFMLATKIWAMRILVLSVPASASRRSMVASTCAVWPAMSSEASSGTWPAR